MNNPKGAIKKNGKWVTKTTGTELHDTGGGTEYSYYAIGKDGKAYFYDPKTDKFTARSAYRPTVPTKGRSIKALEAELASRNTLRGSNKYNASSLFNILEAAADLSNHFKTRKEAFDYARSVGASGFLWKGGSYNTRSAGESINLWLLKMKQNSSNKVDSRFTTGAYGIYNNGKYLSEVDENGYYGLKKMGDTLTLVYGLRLDYTPGSKKGTYIYSSAYDPYMFGNIMGMFSPTNLFGAISRATRGEGHGETWGQRYFDNLLGLTSSTAPLQNKGLASVSLTTEEMADAHPYINAGLNLVVDAATMGGLTRYPKQIVRGRVPTIRHKYKRIPTTIEVPAELGYLEANPFNPEAGLFVHTGESGTVTIKGPSVRSYYPESEWVHTTRATKSTIPASLNYDLGSGLFGGYASANSSQDLIFKNSGNNN